MLGSAYGISFVLAFLLAGFAAFLGARVIGPTAEKLATTPPDPETEAVINRLRGLSMVELGIFLAIFTLMIAMRFGY